MRIAPLLLVLAACGNDTAAEPPDPGPEPVYYGEVETILRENCVECHSNDPDRLAPFSLEGLENAQIAAESTPIAFAVTNRQMPPYFAKNDGSCQTFHDTKWLTDAQIDTLVRWVNGDKLAGEPVAPPPPPSPKTMPNIDKTIDIGTSFMPTAPADEFRCFLVDPLAATDQYLTAVHVRPGNATIVHHVVVYTINDAAAQAALEAEDAKDSLAGYPCSGGPGTATNFLTGWAPGGGVTLFPADTGLLVPGGRKLVIQMHYNSANANGQPDRTAIDLDLAANVAKRAAIVGVFGDINLPPRQVDALAKGSLTIALGNVQTFRVWGGLIHMHTRGTEAEVHLSRNNTCMLDLDAWSFHWQQMYWYEQPFTVNKGESLEVTCHYDTSNDTTNVHFGEGTGDEMCIAYFYISL